LGISGDETPGEVAGRIRNSIENHDLVALGLKATDKVSADEAGTTYD
jgi:hypothetical protein